MSQGNNNLKKKVSMSSSFSMRGLMVLLVVCFLAGCASTKATQQAPELPPKHWLEEAPGVPTEYREKLEAAVPNLYDPNKSFGFDDYIYLTIQQSPLLANSAVDLEIQKLQLTDAVWKYLPEPRATVQISNNLTSYNSGLNDVAENYGQPKFSLGFDAAFPNPFSTYFNHQAQKILVNIAISTHRKAIGAAIADIAKIYQEMDAKNQMLEIQKELIPLKEKITAYWKQLEAVDGPQGVALDLSMQHEREAALKVERTGIEINMLRTRLKAMAGLELQQKLNVNADDAKNILRGFDGETLSWENRWATSEDELIVRAQLRLQDFNIMLAWAEYIPDITLTVNNSPPGGQYQPVDGREDTFLHLNFDFPLIDWGRRYRGVQTARMEKAKAYQEQAQMRTKFSNVWVEAQQNVILAETSLKIAQNTLEVAKMKVKEASINFQEGIILFPELAEQQEALIEARVGYVSAELAYKLAQTTWMDVSGVLVERYIGTPAKEIL